MIDGRTRWLIDEAISLSENLALESSPALSLMKSQESSANVACV